MKIYTQEIPNQPRDPQRAENLRYALAEDKLIALLLRNPDYGPQLLQEIAPGEFVTDQNRAIFAVLYERLRAGKSIDPMILSSELTAEQMSRDFLPARRKPGTGLLDGGGAGIHCGDPRQTERENSRAGRLDGRSGA